MPFREKKMNRSLYSKLAKVCRKESPADCIFKNASIFDAYTATFYPGDVAIKQGHIAGIGRDFLGTNVIDCKGKSLVPAFIDAHCHPEATMVSPHSLLSTAVLYGTTTFIVNPKEAVLVSGKAGLDYLLSQSEKCPANVFFMLPYLSLRASTEEQEARFDGRDIFSYLRNPRILGLEEIMDTKGVIHSNPVLWKTREGTESKFPGGHSAFLSEDREDSSLIRLQTGEIPKDFSYTLQEVHSGMHIHIKEGAIARNLDTLIEGILSEKIDSRSFSFCADDKTIDAILREGHINHSVKKAIALGLPMGKAYQMATINAAECYHLPLLGAIAPGKQADFLLLSDPKEVLVEAVYHKGKRIERTEKPTSLHYPKELRKTLHFSAVEEEDFLLPILKRNTMVLGIQENAVETSHMQVNFKRCGNFDPSRFSSYRKVASLSRHKGKQKMTLSICHGYTIRQGAIASSLSRDCDGILVIGDSDRDMCLAVNELLKMQGGIALVSRGTVVKRLPLPVMGMITENGEATLETELREMKEKLHEMGISLNMDPLMPLRYLSSPTLPEIRITPEGVYIIKDGSSRLCKG